MNAINKTIPVKTSSRILKKQMSGRTNSLAKQVNPVSAMSATKTASFGELVNFYA